MYISLKERKERLRSRHKRLRRAVLPEIKAERDHAISQYFLSTMAYKQSGQVLCYASLPIEVSTSEISACVFADGKKCLYPRCAAQGEMTFHSVQSLDELRPAFMGIQEPVQDAPAYIPKDKDICIVPALSYDVFGYRMGYGGGYYDRFLSDFEGVKVGLCYMENIEKRLPRGKYDIKVDILITETGIFRLK